MKIAFRTDASNQIGSGHVVRCATLAMQLRERGADVTFLCRELPGHYAEWLTERKLSVLRLPAPSAPVTAGGHAAWLGVPMATDIEQSADALRRAGPFEWLIVDHYA